MQINEAPRTHHGTKTEFRYPSTHWIRIRAGAQEVNTLQPEGLAQNCVGENRKPESVEERLNQAIRHLGGGSLVEARKLRTAQKRELAVKLSSGYPVSLICRLLDLPRSSYYYRSSTPRDFTIFDAVQRVIQDHPGYGYRRITNQLQHEGWNVSPKRVYLLMRRLRSLEE